MNRFYFAICFLLLFNCSLNLNAETLYDIIINIFKGLAISENSQCIDICESNKEEIMKLLTDMINEFKKGKPFTSLVLPYGMKLFAIKDLMTKCQILTILDIYNRLITKEGIKGIGNGVYNNADEIYGYIKQSKEKGIFLTIGKLLSVVLNVYVN